jgi:hypothetical protein
LSWWATQLLCSRGEVRTAERPALGGRERVVRGSGGVAHRARSLALRDRCSVRLCGRFAPGLWSLHRGPWILGEAMVSPRAHFIAPAENHARRGGGGMTLSMRRQSRPWPDIEIPTQAVRRHHRDLHRRGQALPGHDDRPPFAPAAGPPLCPSTPAAGSPWTRSQFVGDLPERSAIVDDA